MPQKNYNKRMIVVIFTFCLLLFHLNWQGKTTYLIATGLDQLKQDQVNQIQLMPKELVDWKITWLGHNGYLLQNNHLKILLDPVHDPFIKGIARAFISFDPSSLGDIDLVIISHPHFDHLSLNTLKLLQKIDAIIVPKGNAGLLQDLKVKNIIEVVSGETITQGIKITIFDAQHNGSRYHPFHSQNKANSYLIDDGKSSIYFAGDTGFGDHLNQVALFKPNISILPIGAFEPKFILNYYHMNPMQASRASKILQTNVLIPSHFGTYRMSLDLTNEALPMLMNYHNVPTIKIYLPPLYVSKNSI